MFEDNIHNNKLNVLGKLTAGLFHEIRNPLSAIKLNLEFLKLLEKDLPLEANESICYSFEALDRIEQLINTVMDFSRKNESPVNKTSVYEITSKATEILSCTASKENIKIFNRVSPDVPLLFFDKNKFLQIILNLMTNAIEACNSNGEIVIRAGYNGNDNLVWQIEDNGKGISEEDKEKIFSDFYTNKEKGTGMGLSVCKMLLKEYNSELKFESTLGKGSKFSIIFNSNLFLK